MVVESTPSATGGSPGAAEPALEEKENYPPRKVVLTAMVGIYLAVFLIALDRTILGTAIPAISNEFQSFGDIAWYEAGFLLPLCMLQLTFGRVYRYYSTKWVIVSLVAIFEIGSIVAAAAPNSSALIVGRAITGAGGGGISAGALILINNMVPLRLRPKYMGGVGSMFGLASIVGPLLGGYLTAVTWRWCFWINVPIGAVSLVVLAFVTPNIPPAMEPADTLWGRVKQLDPLGFVLVAPATVCLLFAMQWGGTRYPWSDARIIALLVLFGVLGTAFVGVQLWLKEDATVPPRIIGQRSVLWACIASIGVGTLMVIYAFYLPLWFQAIQGKSPQSSGLSLLPLLLSIVIFVGVCGGLITWLGYYTPFVILGGAVSIAGAALISTWEVDTTTGMWIGYQIVLGAGLGFTMQGPNLAAQTVLSKADIPIGLTVLSFIQFLGGTIFVSVCQTLLENKLVSGLAGKIPGLDPSAIASQGATLIRQLVPPDELTAVLEVYNDSLRPIWYIGVAMSALTFVAAFGLEWKSVKGQKTDSSSEGAEKASASNETEKSLSSEAAEKSSDLDETSAGEAGS